MEFSQILTKTSLKQCMNSQISKSKTLLKDRSLVVIAKHLYSKYQKLDKEQKALLLRIAGGLTAFIISLPVVFFTIKDNEQIPNNFEYYFISTIIILFTVGIIMGIKYAIKDNSKKEKSMDEIMWNSFKEWAEENGINMEENIDYQDWWDCWKTAWETANSI